MSNQTFVQVRTKCSDTVITLGSRIKGVVVERGSTTLHSVSSGPYIQRCQPKKIKIWEIANVNFFDLRKL